MNFVAFLWLFGSAFSWSHDPSQFNNAWLVGMLGCMFANLAQDVPVFRYANAVLGLWLVASVWVLPAETMLTLWASTAVGIVAQIASLVPARGSPATPGRIESIRRR